MQGNEQTRARHPARGPGGPGAGVGKRSAKTAAAVLASLLAAAAVWFGWCATGMPRASIPDSPAPRADGWLPAVPAAPAVPVNPPGDDNGRRGAAIPPATTAAPAWSETVAPAGSDDLAEAIDLLSAERDPMTEEALLDELLADVPWETAGDALLRIMATGRHTRMTRELAARLARLAARRDASAAAEWVQVLPEGEERLAALDQVAIAWVEQSPADALAWARGLPADMAHARAARQVAYELAREYPVAALELALCQPAGRSRDDLIRHALRQWAEADPPGAALFALEINESGLREAVLGDMAGALAGIDPAAAIDLALGGMVSGRSQDDAVVAVIQRWVQSDPHAASDWVQRLPESVLKDAAMDNLFGIWIARDPDGLHAWLDAFPP